MPGLGYQYEFMVNIFSSNDEVDTDTAIDKTLVKVVGKQCWTILYKEIWAYTKYVSQLTVTKAKRRGWQDTDIHQTEQIDQILEVAHKNVPN